MPQKYDAKGAKRPFGPDGMPCVHNCSATWGASRLATAQALGGFMISAPLPDTSHLLFEESSHAKTSGGSTATSFFMYSRTCFTLSDFTVTLPLASTSSAPYAPKSVPMVSTESAV